MYDELRGSFRTPKGHEVEMTYRADTNDWNTLNACMTEDEYRLAERTVDGCAVDVGGYLGGVGIGLALDNPQLQVVIIEPVPSNAALIRGNIDAAGLRSRVILIEGAVGTGGEDVDVWYGYRGTEALEHHAFVGNSTLAYDNPGEAEHDTVTHTAISLAELVRAYGPLSLVKIDTEGAEWSFLDSTARKDVALILGEVHPVRGHVPADIIDLLSDTHDTHLDGPHQASGPCGFVAVRR